MDDGQCDVTVAIVGEGEVSCSGEREKEGWRISAVTIASADVAACANVRGLGLPLTPPYSVVPTPTLWL
jgi:hypothetical protein